MENVNWVAFLGGSFVGGVISFLTAVYSKRMDLRGAADRAISDGRAAAEAALINMPGPIIAEQNRRISELNGEIDRLWRQIHEGHERERKCQEEINVLQGQLTEQRHEVRELKTKMNALEFRLGTLRDDGLSN